MLLRINSSRKVKVYSEVELVRYEQESRQSPVVPVAKLEKRRSKSVRIVYTTLCIFKAVSSFVRANDANLAACQLYKSVDLFPVRVKNVITCIITCYQMLLIFTELTYTCNSTSLPSL